MLSRIRIWQVMALQVAIGGLSAFCLAAVLHYPDVARRPQPPSCGLAVGLMLFLSAGVLALLALGVRSPKVSTAGVITSTIAVWLLGCYALVFIFINTYGT
jgi:hypothetical protein